MLTLFIIRKSSRYC